MAQQSPSAVYSPPKDSHSTESQKRKVSLILEINAELITLFTSQQEVPTDGSPAKSTDPALAQACIVRLQQNLSYLAGLADRAIKNRGEEKPMPILKMFDAPVGTPADCPLPRLYALLASLVSEKDDGI